jgi:hypothetical protein
MKDMVEKFQCPGCVAGINAQCGAFDLQGTPQEGQTCAGWRPGTTSVGIGSIALGLPKGFNHLGCLRFAQEAAAKKKRHSLVIRLFTRDVYQEMLHQPADEPDLLSSDLNVPVWAMEEDGYLFVRMFAPRVGWHWIDVIRDGTLDMVPQAIDVGRFKDKMD